MASTYSPSLKLELIGNGDQSGTWGTTTNTNLGTLLEQAITGVQTITMVNANYTLSSYNGASDEARNAVLVIEGTNSAIRNIIAPSENKIYIIANNTVGGYDIVIKTSTSTGVTIPNGATVVVYCDGTEFYTLSQNNEFIGAVTIDGDLSVTGTTSLISTTSKAITSTTSTVTANAFIGCISGNVLIVTSVIAGSIATGQFISGRDMLDGTKISGAGTGTGAAVIVGSISGTTLTVDSVTSGSLNIGQYILGNGVTQGTRIASGAGSTWGLTVSQTVAAGTVISAYGAGSSGIGNYVVDVPSAVFVGSIADTTLTVNSVTSGTIASTQLLYGVGVIGGTTISSGSGLSWVVNTSQTTPLSSTFYAYSPSGSGITQTVVPTPIIGAANVFGLANARLVSNVAAVLGTMAPQYSNAVNITGGTITGVTITGITDLTVPDGGTGVSTITPNAIVVGNGTGAITSLTPSTNGNFLKSTAGASVTAGSFVVGTQYTITSLGTTTFTSIGATSGTFTGTINNAVTPTPGAGTILTVTSGSGLAVGQIISGSGITANTKITAQISATTWAVDNSQLIGSTTITYTNPVFTATNVGTGTGTATTNVWTSQSTNGLTSGTTVTLTGNTLTSADFTVIPSWVKRITIMISGVSFTTAVTSVIRLGTSAGWASSGYLGAAMFFTTGGIAGIQNSTSFAIYDNSPSSNDSLQGSVTFTLLDSSTNTWAMSGSVANSNYTQASMLAGSIALPAVLDRIQLNSSTGVGVFDAGLVNIQYE